MQKTPKGLRLHIGLYGRRNVGKSSFLNAVTRQSVSVVSDVAGTTTDPVEKPMEMLPVGPVLFIDTAGIDDAGVLGDQRTEKTRKAFERTDIGVLIAEGKTWGDFEEGILHELRSRGIPVIVVFNKCDLYTPDAQIIYGLREKHIPFLDAVATDGQGPAEFRQELINILPEDFVNPPPLLGDLIPKGDLAVLVVPIDLEAPKGRLIYPQVQSIRDVLDHDCYCLMVKENELSNALARLNRPPALVVTDSQAVEKVAADTPEDIPMTTFSIIYSRYKGDLEEQVKGVKTIGSLAPGDQILIAEACTHHPIEGDIGTVKIPNWLEEHIGGKLEFTHAQGRDFPEDLTPFKLVIHCGACMWNRRQVLTRIMYCRQAGVPITNYGLAISFLRGVLPRALKPFNYRTLT